jgi:S-DNA-T family DNA segregation ATPase FtsK/SpoIIIE
MGRHKSFKIPFLKVKLKSKTIYGIFSLLFLLLFGLTLLSFNQEATVLKMINEQLGYYFGSMSFLFTFVFLFASGVMVQSKRFRVIKPNWLLGYLLIFISGLIVANTGYLGTMLNEQISSLLSTPGTLITFTFVFLVGVLIFFEISLPDFVKGVAGVLDNLFSGVVKYMEKMKKNRAKSVKEKEKEREKEDRNFIGGAINKETVLAKRPQTGMAKFGENQALAEPLLKPMSMHLTGEKWKFPPLSLLSNTEEAEAERGDVKKNAAEIEEALDSFGIKARVADINYGPAVTQYALQIAKGVKLNKITSLSNNLALALASPHGLIRIEAPIPGKNLVGIEVPCIRPAVVPLRKMLALPTFTQRENLLRVPMGLDVSNQPQFIDINAMPHVLIAGTTGSGKSVLLATWITTLLFRTTPEELRLILIDPKRVTFMPFDDLPHLMTNVITDLKDTISALKWAVKEMEKRYELLSAVKARDIFSYNLKNTDPEKKMPFIVIVIDELADLMMFASKEVEDSITRIAQKARAVGLYLIIATQRPSVDVITGLMKANIPARLAFNVSSMIDSRVIIDMPGAEKLLGKGDMLFMSPNSSKPSRIQGPFVTDAEVTNLVEFLKTNQPAVHYTEEVTQQAIKTIVDSSGKVMIRSSDKDLLFTEAMNMVCSAKKASASLLQRRFSIGYSRAARILDELEEAGIVGPADASKPREVLVSNPEQFVEKPE